MVRKVGSIEKVASDTLLDSDGQQTKTSIAELKNGKVIFKQKPHSFEKHSETLQGTSLCTKTHDNTDSPGRTGQVPRNDSTTYRQWRICHLRNSG